MSSIVINPKNEKEQQFISDLLEKLGVDAKVLTDEQQEDLGLGLLMREADRSAVAEPDEVYRKLKG
ncbi:MAG: hypothetical protein ABJF04_03315 [Reichenbachiella sp.]|uniref:hypothetical protein n=1 Tax=Reichenbachiella sp. TaxID=2184521 RepID=UPI003265180B